MDLQIINEYNEHACESERTIRFKNYEKQNIKKILGNEISFVSMEAVPCG